MADIEHSAQQDAAAGECMPCRGTGRLHSQLGGHTSVVQCPWCEGSGRRRAGVDAQARWLGEGKSADAAAPAGEAQRQR
jgi:hypothetical protein